MVSLARVGAGISMAFIVWVELHRKLREDVRMSPLERKLIRRLIFEPESMSRNRNFHAFSDPLAAHARRRAIWLRSVLSGFNGDDTVQVDAQWENGRLAVTMRDDARELTRTSYLSTEELEILREDTEFERFLSQLSSDNHAHAST